MDNFNGTIPTLPSDSGKIVQMMGNGSSSAYLFLFSPREMTAQYRRPYDYKFNDKFRGDLSDLITRNMSGVSSLVDDFMLNSADARTSVLPTATAIPLSSSSFTHTPCSICLAALSSLTAPDWEPAFLHDAKANMAKNTIIMFVLISLVICRLLV